MSASAIWNSAFLFSFDPVSDLAQLRIFSWATEEILEKL